MDPIQAEIIWTAFMRHTMHWMLNEQRPVDCGYFILHALPLRPNWREIILAWQAEEPTEPLWKLMMRQELLMWSKKPKRILRSIYTEHKESWWYEVFRFERKRAYSDPQAGGRELWQYIGAIGSLITRQIKNIQNLYDDFVSQIKRPFVLVDTERNSRGTVTRTKSKQRGAIKPAPVPSQVSYSYDAGRKQVVVPVGLEDPGATVGDVPSLSTVRLPAGDVRDSGGEVEQSGNGQA